MGASLVAQLVKNPSWIGKISWRRDRLPTPVFMGFPGGSDGKESTCNGGDLDSIPGLGRSHGGGRGNPLQYSCLENPMDRGACRLQSRGSQGVLHNWAAERSTPLVCDSKGSTSLTAAVSAVAAAAAAASDSVLLPLKLIFACYVQSFTPLINHVRHSY